MSNDLPGIEMIDLQNAVDSEFEVAKLASVCNRYVCP